MEEKLKLESTFGNRLQLILEEKEIQYIDLAKYLHTNRSTITNWIKGKYGAKRNTLETIANYLEVNPVWLMGYNAPKVRPNAEDSLVVPIDMSKYQKPTEEQLEKIKAVVEVMLSENKKEDK